MVNDLQKGTFLLIFSGAALSIYGGITHWQKRRQKKTLPLFRVSLLFLILVILSFVLTLNMAFTVVDDYVYWGIMGKYLYINNHLPLAGCSLDPRILAYTPGTSLVHYFFYVLTGRYSVHMSYFAQNIVLISALFVVVDKENIKKSLVYIGVLILLMTVFFGSVFTKLQVDYLLSIICFAIFWIYYTEKNLNLKLLIVSIPICFLFLIKEIGFALGLLIMAVIFFDVLADNKIDLNAKFKSLAFILLTCGTLFLLKKLWISHVSAMGFVEFHNAINWGSIKDTFYIFSDGQIHKGAFIFIKDVIIGPADRLNIPYLFWYIIIVFLWCKRVQIFQDNEKSRFVLFSALVLIVFLIYLFSLYCLQIIVFKVGSAYDHTIGLSRYLNIMFSPIVFIMIITWFSTIIFNKHEVKGKILFSFLGIVLLVLGLSRIEVSMNRESQDIQIQKVSRQIENNIKNDIHSIGLITGKNDNIPNLQFLYHLLPNRIDLNVKNNFINHDELIEYILKYDYVLLYQPKPIILDWLQPYVGKETRPENISFLRVLSDKSKNKSFEEFSLERVLL
jgi:hypothetical protein